jgi:hypothetical protein
MSTYFNKDNRDLFMSCIMLMCQLYHVEFHFCCSIVLLLLDFYLILFDFCFPFDSFAFHCSLFMRKIFNSDPGLYSRYFDPVVREVPVHHHLCKSNKHHTSDCTIFVLV